MDTAPSKANPPRRRDAYNAAGRFVVLWKHGTRPIRVAAASPRVAADDHAVQPNGPEISLIATLGGFAAEARVCPDYDRAELDAAADDALSAAWGPGHQDRDCGASAPRQQAQDVIDEFGVAVDAVAALLLERGSISGEEAERAADQALAHVRRGALVMNEPGLGPTRRPALELLQAHKSEIDAYRNWLAMQRPFLGRQWESRLRRSENDGAVWEAVAWTILNSYGLQIASAESKKRGGPDWLCRTGEYEFLVEATALAIDGKAAKSGLRDRVLEGGFYGPLTTQIEAAIEDKTGQAASRPGMPVVVLTGTLHQGAAIHCLRSSHTRHLPEALFLADAPCGHEPRTAVRQSIAAVLVATPFALPQRPRVLGLLHPRPTTPFPRDALSTVPFLGLAPGWQEGRVEIIDL